MQNVKDFDAAAAVAQTLNRVNNNIKPSVSVRNRGNRDPTWRYWVTCPQTGRRQWVPSVSEILTDCGLVQDVGGINRTILHTKTLVSSVVHLAMETVVKKGATADHNWEAYERQVREKEREQGSDKYAGIIFDKAKAERYVCSGAEWWEAFKREHRPVILGIENSSTFGAMVGGTADLWLWLPKLLKYSVPDWKTTNVASIPDYYGYQLAGYVLIGLASSELPIPSSLDPTWVERRIVLLRDDDRPVLTKTDFPSDDFQVFQSAVKTWHTRERYNAKNRMFQDA